MTCHNKRSCLTSVICYIYKVDIQPWWITPTICWCAPCLHAHYIYCIQQTNLHKLWCDLYLLRGTSRANKRNVDQSFIVKPVKTGIRRLENYKKTPKLYLLAALCWEALVELEARKTRVHLTDAVRSIFTHDISVISTCLKQGSVQLNGGLYK